MNSTTAEHPNIALLKRVHPRDLDPDVFDEGVVFHYYNSTLPELNGDHKGIEGVRDFFAKLNALSKGTFRVHPISIWPVGDELLVTHSKNTLTINNKSIETDVAVVWRIVNGKIAEVFDIPSTKSGAIVNHIIDSE